MAQGVFGIAVVTPGGVGCIVCSACQKQVAEGIGVVPRSCPCTAAHFLQNAGLPPVDYWLARRQIGCGERPQLKAEH